MFIVSETKCNTYLNVLDHDIQRLKPVGCALYIQVSLDMHDVVMNVGDGRLFIDHGAILVHLGPSVEGVKKVPCQRDLTLYLPSLMEHEVNDVVIVIHR